MKAPTFKIAGKHYVRGFHVHSGWFFLRQADGSVRAFRVKPVLDRLKRPHTETDLTISASSWASIVASVSAHGETGTTYGEALAFHQRDAAAADRLAGAIFLAHSAGFDDEAIANLISAALPSPTPESEGC